MSRKKSKAPSQRQLRVGEELRHALSRILARGAFHDPALAEANITVTEVRISPDLKNATAFVVTLGGRELAEKVRALNHAAGFVRGLLADEVTLRFLPRLRFEADRSFDAAAQISRILERPSVARDLDPEAPGEAALAEGEPGPEPDGHGA